MAILWDKPIDSPQTSSLDDKYNEVPEDKFEERGDDIKNWGTPFLESGSRYIGQLSPPRFIVVDISQLNLSLCLFNSSPFL